MADRINLFFCNPVSYGGHVTFTVHLMRGLRNIGVDVHLYKIRKRSEHFRRKFGYEEEYRNITIEDAKKLRGPKLITAPSKPMKDVINEMLNIRSCNIVIHDPAEFKHGWDVNKAAKKKPIVIRKRMQEYFYNSHFLLHPYDRCFSNAVALARRKATGISISRIDFDKHTELLLDANRLLPKKKQIEIRGFENRIYTRFNIMPNYPEWVQSKAAYDKGLRTATEMCKEYLYMFDMSIIKGDGGGTQYSFLEAMDAGTVVVLHDEWIKAQKKFNAMQRNINCLTASSGEDIAKLIKRPISEEHRHFLRSNAFKLLKKHKAETSAKKLVRML